MGLLHGFAGKSVAVAKICTIPLHDIFVILQICFKGLSWAVCNGGPSGDAKYRNFDSFPGAKVLPREVREAGPFDPVGVFFFVMGGLLFQMNYERLYCNHQVAFQHV